MAGVPATVGGMLRMNASAFGGCMEDVFRWALVYEPSVGKKLLSKNDVSFDYRGSSFEKYIILEVGLGFECMGVDRVREMVRLNVKRRLEYTHLRNTFGSVFKNPEGVSAGELIDKCGLKGFKYNTVSISSRHANFMVGWGDVNVDDVLRLIDMVKGEVFRRFGIVLEEEVQII